MNNNIEKEIKTHKESYFMYERTKKEAEERMKEAMNPDGSKKFTPEQIKEKIDMLNFMQDEVKQKFINAGGNVEDLVIYTTVSKKTTVKPKKISIKREKRNTVELSEVDNKIKKPTLKKQKKEVSEKLETITQDNKKSQVNTETPLISPDWDSLNFSDSFDVIPLPSRGKCYENKMSTIAVSYLTANDENMIVSPNLYRDGLILDYLLKAKINNKNIDPDDLVEGDREAIILWLRATGYGTQYPITVTDNKTGVNFDTVVDLTQIKHKPFVLESDENGYFDYKLPISKDDIKFRFLTHGDVKQIEEIEKEEQVDVKKERLSNIVYELNNFIENETILNKDEKLKLYEAKKNIDKWIDKLGGEVDFGYTHKLTNKLELSIVSINGNENRDYISDYVQNMNTRDALAIRRYISDNEPGLDYAVTVERPESLGGGSMPVFLSLDEYLFLNIT